MDTNVAKPNDSTDLIISTLDNILNVSPKDRITNNDHILSDVVLIKFSTKLITIVIYP